jgi:hypothetical protein
LAIKIVRKDLSVLKPELNRREFVKLTAGAGAALAVPSIAFPGEPKKMIGIQIGAVSFVDEGTEKVLDILQELSHIPTPSPRDRQKSRMPASA